MSFTVQHKRSGELSRRPDPAQLAPGQIAVNYNKESAGLFFKTDSGTLVKAGPVHIGALAPSLVGWNERSIGEMWLDISIPSVPLLRVWTEAGWTTVSAAQITATVFVPPTSAAGLPSGAVWNNGGVLTIVP